MKHEDKTEKLFRDPRVKRTGMWSSMTLMEDWCKSLLGVWFGVGVVCLVYKQGSEEEHVKKGCNAVI